MRFSVFGEVLARRAAVILNELDRAREEINILLSGSTGRVSIGTIDGPAVDLLTSIIFRLQKNFPGIDLEIRTGSSIGLFGDLLRGEVDIMIGRPPEDASPQDFTIRNAGREPMVLAARPKHPLAGRKKRDIRDIANYPLILQRRGGRSRLRLETLFQEAGIPLPSSVIGSDSLVVTLACIADSDALTILSEPVALQQERYHQITGIPTAFDLSISSYGILTSVVRPPTPAARMVMTLLLEAADGDESPMSEENPTAPQAQDSFLEE
ncbi:LysR family transcriptional regulator [Acetobacter oeni LMG 21952]|nr:LysR family transcriptional regulator [Acetobacter oeni LMG 21952]